MVQTTVPSALGRLIAAVSVSRVYQTTRGLPDHGADEGLGEWLLPVSRVPTEHSI